MNVTIVGAGRMGEGIGTRMIAGGNDIELVDVDPESAAAVAKDLDGRGPGHAATSREGTFTGEVVVLALPYGAATMVVREHHDELTGKVVVDISNPVDFTTMDGLATPPGTSAAEEVAAVAPDASRVVKAFNTTFARTLVAGTVAGQPLDVLIAGDGEQAKSTIAGLVEAGGLRAIDVGPLRRARELEHLGFLHISLQDRLGTGYGSAIKFLW